MDWATVAIGGVTIVAGFTSFTKIITSRKKNNSGTIDCDKKHAPLTKVITEMNKRIGGIEQHLANIDGWLERNGKT
jgi:hypothetical protein